jgi:acyl-CoA reductase-like NAD-dependent aldehyde dehydrogenase
MAEHYPLLIPGAKAAGTPKTVTAPFDLQSIATFDCADWTALDAALAKAYALYRNRDAWLPPPKRIEILRKVAVMLRAERESLAKEAAREGGKPLVDSLVEVDRAIDGVELCVQTLRTQAGVEIPMNMNPASANRMACTHHEPIGVVVAFSAFNHPLNLIVHQIGPAIAAGCPVLVKPAEATPISCYRLVKMFHAAGLPADWCQAFIAADHDVSAKLIADERVAFLTFIGSAKVGWMLRSKLAPGARCSLEHGGTAPVVVAADANLETALPLLCKGGFYHAGQVCVSVQRVYAEKAIAKQLAEKLAGMAEKLKVGDPTLPETEVGPLIRPSEVERVHKWVEAAAAGGAKLLCGGKALSKTTYAPTVLLDPADHADVTRHEVFGPVVCVYSCENIDEAIRRSNDSPFAFQAAVFTRSLDTSLRAAKRLDAATVMINDHTAFRVDWMPFAGLKQSGLGIGGIPFTMHDMQVEKLIVVRSQEL